MAHYAYIDESNTVIDVIVGPDESTQPDSTDSWEAYFSGKGKGQALQTSYNTRGGVHYDPETGEPSEDQTKALRFNYAGIGFTFDETKGTDGAFIPPKPFDSWELDEATCLWVAPIEYPAGGGTYAWDEELQEWTAVENETE
jgi:hypothetical protein